MPGMNGCETLQEIRKLDDVTPIYIITAFHQEFFEYLKEATEQNLNFELLHKPVDSEILLKVVKGILDKPGSL
jgi:YesN/AraC family two-component response regulator